MGAEGAITAERQGLEEELMQRRASHGEVPNHEDAVTLYRLGVLCRKEGDLKAARDFAERARSTQQTTNEDNSNYYIQSLYQIMISNSCFRTL